ncbi:MAG: hypothetical protein ACKVPX_12725 [Myxococcaceae bacterium]
MRASVLLGLGAALWLGCPDKRGEPSEAFERAHSAFIKLYAAKLDSAYGDPAIHEIVEALQQVPPDSSDAQAAKELTARIVEGRTQRAAQEAERRRLTARALAAESEFVSAASVGEDDTEVREPSDPQLALPAAGMPRAEFEKRFGDCFELGAPLDMAGRGIRDTYRLKDIARCRDRYPSLQGAAVAMEGAAVLGVIPGTSFRDVPRDAGVPPPPTVPPAAAPLDTPKDAGSSGPGWGGF